MATTTKRTLEDRASRIRMKSEMLNYLPSPKEDSYGTPFAYAKDNRWNFDADKYATDEEYKITCEKEYSAYKD